MMVMPDTNVWIRWLNPGPSPVKERFFLVDAGNITMCSVVLAELYFGACNSIRFKENLATIRKLEKTFPILPFDQGAARIYGRIRANLSRSGNIIGPNDLMIAAVALVNDVTLVTHNTREFARVSGLRLVDWEAPVANG